MPLGKHILLITCPDAVGLIHKITDVLLSHQLNIVSNDEFVDPEYARFFMRTEFTGGIEPKELLDELRSRLPADSQVRLTSDQPRQIVVFASKEPHCLGDLLIRHCNGELNAKIQAVISNHEVLQPLAARFEIPFYHVPAENDDRRRHEEKIGAVLHGYRPEFIVLAKYMRVITSGFIEHYPNRILNIHHSFLPAFVGAQPYRQAYNRGVKIIGATAHFVTETLDDGPIIAQSVLPVSHAHTPKSMAQEGREIEKIVLARALNLVLEDRVFVSGNKTIIFE
jgi:formyltetrahydrofolate deformylase